MGSISLVQDANGVLRWMTGEEIAAAKAEGATFKKPGMNSGLSEEFDKALDAVAQLNGFERVDKPRAASSAHSVAKAARNAPLRGRSPWK